MATPDGTTPPAEAVEAAMKAMLCRPGSVMSDPGDREYRLCISSAHGPALFGSGRCEFAEEIAAAVVCDGCAKGVHGACHLPCHCDIQGCGE